MESIQNKKSRLLDIFYRCMKGENISVKVLADEYRISTKSISRDINEIKMFLSDNRDLVGNTELNYDSSTRTYYLEFDNILLSKELITIFKMMIGSRGLSKEELQKIIKKLQSFTSHHDKLMLNELISKELYHYKEVKHDCDSVIDNIWKLTHCIHDKKEITVTYYKADRSLVERKILPMALTFSEYYFYLIAYHSEEDDYKPLYYRVDRIVNIVEHRKHFEIRKEHDFDEGDLRSKIQFMFFGEYQKIKFSYNGPSVQAILDKIQTAKIIDENGKEKIIEAEVYGNGIMMFLLSQGSTIKVLEPESFKKRMKMEIERMMNNY